jgi:hypothetical protein
LAYYNRKAGIIHLLKEQIIYATGSRGEEEEEGRSQGSDLRFQKTEGKRAELEVGRDVGGTGADETPAIHGGVGVGGPGGGKERGGGRSELC